MNILSPIVAPDPSAAEHSHRTGQLHGMNPASIEAKLGFPPNVEDDQDKVEHCWSFRVAGEACAVWDYKGSGTYGRYNTFGPSWALRLLFGPAFESERA